MINPIWFRKVLDLFLKNPSPALKAQWDDAGKAAVHASCKAELREARMLLEARLAALASVTAELAELRVRYATQEDKIAVAQGRLAKLRGGRDGT